MLNTHKYSTVRLRLHLCFHRLSVCRRLHSSANASFFATRPFRLSHRLISPLSKRVKKAWTYASLVTSLSCSLFLLPQTRRRTTRLINNPPKANSPTAHWANSSYQLQIRLCLCGSSPIRTKTPPSNLNTHIHTHLFLGRGLLYVLILIDQYQFQCFFPLSYTTTSKQMEWKWGSLSPRFILKHYHCLLFVCVWGYLCVRPPTMKKNHIFWQRETTRWPSPGFSHGRLPAVFKYSRGAEIMNEE